MILHQLTLRDFCLYRGQQVLDLAPVLRRGRPAPIVLFGGINGGGKTTVLDAVQLALYGNRARCSKRGDKGYEQFLRESVHHDADEREGAGVELSFRYASEGQDHLYSVSRTWSVSGDRVREKVRVCKDGVDDGWLSENWNQLVEELIPLGIAQLCFFDAEKIRFLAEDETSMQALGGAIKSLLGLDLAERLVADASVLEGRLAKRAVESAELAEVRELESEYEARQTDIDRLVREVGTLENHRQRAATRVQEVEEQFAKVGGRHWEARDKLLQRKGELQQSLKEAESRLVNLAATDLPLALVPDLLAAVQQRAGAERQAAESEVIVRLLAERDAELLTLLREKRTGQRVIGLVSEFLEADRARRGTLTPAVSRGERWERDRLRLSDAAGQLLDRFLASGRADRQADARQQLEALENVRRAFEDVERSLAATPDEATIGSVVEELKAASAELAGFDSQIARLEKELARLRGERDEFDKQLAKRRRKIVDEELRSEEDSRLARLLVRTQATMQQYLQIATHRKIERLSQSVTESFRFLLRKQTLVQRVLIDPDTFAVTLFDEQGRVLPKQRLSEGEKQIFAISVLWGLSRAAARPLPAIIDTPMARLDNAHRDKLVERYFPHASHQVIVLSTDTEIDRDYFESLQPHIARAYHLTYDDRRKLTVAEEGYFWKL
ncbi:MAG: DNA sulfur modification protein DndD [Pirellulaceae bacterium]|nr:DNA sulfur modification protein DndD [Pirellulaceae bacterium]